MTITALFGPLLDLLTAQTAADAKARWAGGPTVGRKSAPPLPLDTYLIALGALEDAYVGVTPGELYQRLRRLYYSPPSGVGGKFDTVIGTNEYCSADIDRPVTAGGTLTSPLSLDMLNVLFATNTVITPAGNHVDPSHWYAPLDIRYNGLGFIARGPMADVPWSGLVTWAGDLASWWSEWETRREALEVNGVRLTAAEREALLDQSFANRVTKEDLLADMDAQIFAQHVPGSMRLSAYIRTYYAAETTPIASLNASTPNAMTRVPHFVRAANPALQYRVQSEAPLRITIAVETNAVIFLALRRVIEVFETGPVDESDINKGLDMVGIIRDRFITFLKKCMASGDANWPRP